MLCVGAAVLPVLLSACTPPPAEAPGQLVQSDKPRIMSPLVPAADFDELVNGNTDFAFNFYQNGEVAGQSGNIVYSPYSLSIALAMTYAGARSQTATEMAQALRFTLPPERLHPAFDKLDLQLAERARVIMENGTERGRIRLDIVNRLWGQVGYTFLPDFLDTLAENYGAGLNLLDFAEDSEAARVAINDWVAQQTADRIQDLIPPGALDSLTRLVLTNAVYFKAPWLDPFDKQATGDAPFHLLDGSAPAVAMMQRQAEAGYAAGTGYQAVELEYLGSELGMLVIVPNAGEFAACEAGLNGARLREIVGTLQTNQVRLSLPKFTFTWQASIKDVLAGLGMPTAFTDAADFSGMSSEPGLHVGDVLHKAFIAVDEEGTEAAAATAVVMAGTAAPAEPVTLVVDRPFIFVIRDRLTGTVLFVGRVVDPR
jgi:serpin B